jgi:N-acetylneuraminate synthase
MEVEFVAEVSSNHNRDIKRCLEFIDVSAGIGCAAVKFQLFKIEKLFAPEILAKSENHRKENNGSCPKNLFLK